MPVLLDALQAEGALVDVELGWSETRARLLRLALRPVPPPVAARALLDTGAEVTCFDTAIISLLGLPVSGVTSVNLAAHGGQAYVPLYFAGLSVLHPSGNARDNLVVRNLTVLEVPLAGLGYQALIGRDVLARCRFLYSGRDDRFRLSY